METVKIKLAWCLILFGLSVPGLLSAQVPVLPAPGSFPAAQATPQPPSGSEPVIRTIQIAFPTQGNVPSIEPQTYLYYIKTRPSRPSEDVWLLYDEELLLDDFRTLWGTGFLDDLSIETTDEPFPNGVMGKHVLYNMEERERVRIVEYNGSEQLKRTDIEEALERMDAVIQLDVFIDEALLRKVKDILTVMLAEDGYQSPTINTDVQAVAGGPKRVQVTFNIEDGPKSQLQRITFVGNETISGGTLRGQMKVNKEPTFWPLSIFKESTYKEHRFPEDAEAIVQYYRERGHIRVQVGQPQLTTLRDTPDGTERWVEMRIPIEEGRQYRLGKFEFEGVTVPTEEIVRAQFELEEGDYYNESEVRDGIERLQQLYGNSGYMEMLAFPDLSPRDQRVDEDGREVPTDGPAIVDVIMRAEEGDQYFVNRITFTGNRTTRDYVVRREFRLLEAGVFNSNALTTSVRRINQLGYFLPIQDDDITVDQVEGDEFQVNIEVPLEEQNRNQVSFGAGVSQFEGFFGQASFQTGNFMGRGETASVALMYGSRYKNFMLGLSRPYMFNRAISSGVTLFSQEFRFIGQFTQRTTGGNLTLGMPVGVWSRMFMGYSYEDVKVLELNPLYTDPQVLQYNPFLRDSLLIGQDGRRTISKLSPGWILNTIDNPIFPNSGKRLSASFEYAGVGGNTKFYKPRGEVIWYFRTTESQSVGLRFNGEYIVPFGDTVEIPIFERLFMGGEYSIRGFDLRSVGPMDESTGLVLGGNKSFLFNGEYIFTIAPPVRLILFFDTGQVQARGDRFSKTDFKTSTGAEVRFMMPVMNVPLRLIFAYNPQRSGVLDNSFRPESAFNFRFAVGSSF